MLGCCGKSMVEKSRERSKAKKYLYRNFQAGHVSPDEHYLERAGLRGRKIFLCYSLLALLLLFALGHLVVTCVILGVLRFGSTGFLFFLSQESSIVWPMGGNLTNITIATPHGITSFTNSTLSISVPREQQIHFEGRSRSGSSSLLSLSHSSLDLKVGDSLRMTDGSSQQTSQTTSLLFFANSSLVQVQQLSAAGAVKTASTTTHTLNGVNVVEGSQLLRLSGAGGVNIGGGIVNIISHGPVSITGQGVLHLSADRGVSLHGLATPTNHTNYHICITANGTLFLVPSNPLRCRGPT